MSRSDRSRSSRSRSGHSKRTPHTRTASTARQTLIVFALAVLVGTLPLMMGHRTPDTLTASGLVLVVGALVIALLAWAGPRKPLAVPTRSWWIFGGVLTGWVVLQTLPFEALARLFGPYPEALWQSDAAPGQWSPNPAYTLRAWATFVALATVAWLVGRLDHRHRSWLWAVIATIAVLQALYGLAAHAAGSDTVLGIWSRNNPSYVHGTFSNRNLFAGYLALTWPLVIGLWWAHDLPGFKKMPFELRVTGSVIGGAIIGAALLASASRLGSAAGLAGLLVGLVLWTRNRKQLTRAAVWPLYATAFAALVAATWYGLTPLAERLAVTSIEEGRFEVYSRMVGEMPSSWWLWGVGLGGFEAAFKQVQPADMAGWYDYAHNDLLQWLLEMGLVGAGLLAAIAVTLVRNARINRETLPLYAGLAALCLVGLGDFSWHIPSTQLILAIYLGILLNPPRNDHPHKHRSHRSKANPG